MHTKMGRSVTLLQRVKMNKLNKRGGDPDGGNSQSRKLNPGQVVALLLFLFIYFYKLTTFCTAEFVPLAQ